MDDQIQNKNKLVKKEVKDFEIKGRKADYMDRGLKSVQMNEIQNFAHSVASQLLSQQLIMKEAEAKGIKKDLEKAKEHLEKVKKELLGSDNQLRIATGKVEDVSVKKLTKGNATMQAKFEELKKA